MTKSTTPSAAYRMTRRGWERRIAALPADWRAQLAAMRARVEARERAKEAEEGKAER
jgi:hypothetical protein